MTASEMPHDEAVVSLEVATEGRVTPPTGAPPEAGILRPAIRALAVLAVLHAVAIVTVRPMFQVSDEVAYLGGVQYAAVQSLSGDDRLATRLAPPEGAPIDLPGGKPVFQYSVGALYSTLMARVSPATAVVLLRLVLGVSLVGTTLFAALLARQLAPSNPLVLVGTPLLVALHPVMAAYAAAITPDSIANVLSAAALWLLLRFASGRSRAWEPLVLVGVSVTAFLFKDTAFFLLPGIVLGLVARAIALRDRAGSWARAWRRDGWLTLGTVLIVASPFLLLVAQVREFVTHSTNFVQLRALVIYGVPPTQGGGADSLADYLQPVSVFTTFWGHLANFGGNQVWLPVGLGILAAATLVAGGGLAWYVAGRPSWETPAAFVATRRHVVLLLACAVIITGQAPARDLVLGAAEALQGRWLFPMIGPFMALLCLGWSRLLGNRPNALPFLGLAFGAISVAALLAGLIPAFYDSFPQTYRSENLFLRGPFGRELDMRAVMTFLDRPAWLRSPWIAWPPVLAFAAGVLAWPFGVYRRLRGADAGRPDRRTATGPG
jgi:hypothetical protein